MLHKAIYTTESGIEFVGFYEPEAGTFTSFGYRRNDEYGIGPWGAQSFDDLDFWLEKVADRGGIESFTSTPVLLERLTFERE